MSKTITFHITDCGRIILTKKQLEKGLKLAVIDDNKTVLQQGIWFWEDE